MTLTLTPTEELKENVSSLQEELTREEARRNDQDGSECGECAELKRRVKELESELEDVQNEVNVAVEEGERMEADSQKLQSSHADLESQLQDLKGQLQNANDELSVFKSKQEAEIPEP